MNPSNCVIGRTTRGVFPRGRVLLSWLTFTAWLLQPGQSAEKKEDVANARGVLIRFEGTITPLLEQYFYRKLESARQQKAGVVIVEIDSPGGFLDSSLDISKRLCEVDWARTVAFIPREALSGAAIAALGCDDIVMADDARLGDAGPIFQGEDALFRYAPEKIRSELAGRLRDLAKAKGRPPALAEAMVDMNLVVYHVQNQKTGEETFMSENEIKASKDPNQWEKKREVLESGKNRFLTVNGEQAVELRLAQGLARNRKELTDRYKLGRDLVISSRPAWTRRSPF